MNKTIKVIYLLMMLLIVNTCVAFAQSEEKNTQTYNWQAFDIGPAEDYNYAFDTNSIKYARNEDGSINKNIIIYQEKKINNVPMSSEFNYYTITQCKLNIEQTKLVTYMCQSVKFLSTMQNLLKTYRFFLTH